MASTIQSSDLDFNNIKANLTAYFRQQSEFADYDFEASGLSNILDVLAYNTHINGLIANFALNETFLNSSQLRSSVVSHAEMLGYSPRSKTASKASVNLSLLITAGDRPNKISIPAFTKFNTSIDGSSYVFQTLESYVATDDGSGEYVFVDENNNQNLQIAEGVLRTKTFIVGDVSDQQIYVIPDKDIDTTTVLVNVYDTTTSTSYTTYSDLNKAIRIDQSSYLYQIKEVPNGYFELIFGDGSVLGNSPSVGNKIVISYLATSANEANGADIFTTQNDVFVGGVDYPLITTTVSASNGGSANESIASIKQNASIAFASQQRMVTAEDYKAQILANYSSSIADAIAWGGQDNTPPIYGRTYVGLQFIDGVSDAQKQTIKDSIVINLTNNLAIMSIDTVFSDPVNVYLELTTRFNFDPDQTNTTVRSAEFSVTNIIETYFNEELKKFNKVFRRSTLLSRIDNINQAILNSRMDVKIQLRIEPTFGALNNFILSYPVTLAAPNLNTPTITSSRFTYLGQTAVIRNRLGTNILQIQSLAEEVIIDNIGEYTPSTGVVELTAFNPEAATNDIIKISAVPTNESTIRPLRNYVIDIDSGLSFAKAQIDYQNTLNVLS
jgi:hypothetical protein